MTEFVNADVIAQGLSAFNAQSVALAAGRLMLDRLNELAASRSSFAFETTLASRSFVPWLREHHARGYESHLVYLWLPAPEVAIARVRARVAAGGHDVPVETIRRRFLRGMRNLRTLYMPLVTTWRVLDADSSAFDVVARELGHDSCPESSAMESVSGGKR